MTIPRARDDRTAWRLALISRTTMAMAVFIETGEWDGPCGWDPAKLLVSQGAPDDVPVPTMPAAADSHTDVDARN